MFHKLTPRLAQYFNQLTNEQSGDKQNTKTINDQKVPKEIRITNPQRRKDTNNNDQEVNGYIIEEKSNVPRLTTNTKEHNEINKIKMI